MLFGKLKKKEAPVFADVYVYGRFSTCTYSCSAGEYRDGELVVVDVMGKLYPGRIVGLYPDPPKDVPKSVKFKPVEKALRLKDKKTLVYWSDKVEQLLSENL